MKELSWKKTFQSFLLLLKVERFQMLTYVESVFKDLFIKVSGKVITPIQSDYPTLMMIYPPTIFSTKQSLISA